MLAYAPVTTNGTGYMEEGEEMTKVREIASGLRFPEGPVALPDGSVLVVEIARGTLTRVTADGRAQVVATPGGGPNGAAFGPDGNVYLCNNGGFAWIERDGRLIPGEQDATYGGGRIERVDLASGRVEPVYTACDGIPLKGPNDLVFDRAGGFWFTDHGKSRARERDRTGVFYARPDGSHIREKVFPVDTPNGIGLSPDEDRLYVAETHAARLWAYDLSGPGELARTRSVPWGRGHMLAGMTDFAHFDSLAVDAAGNICIATVGKGGITVLSPEGRLLEHVAMPDLYTTNICFGGPDMKTAYVTLSATGRLVAIDWPRPGLPLNFLPR